MCAGCNDPFNAKAAGVTKMTCSGSCMKVKAENGMYNIDSLVIPMTDYPHWDMWVNLSVWARLFETNHVVS